MFHQLLLSAFSSPSTSGPVPSLKVPVPSVKWAASLWCVLVCLAENMVFIFVYVVFFHVHLLSQVENGKLGEHEHSSTMEHVRLLLPMVLSLTRTQVQVSDSGEWQEDSGLGLYRAPEEGVNMATAAASVHTVDLEKKVSLKAEHFCLGLICYMALHVSVSISRQVIALENIVCVLNREVERSAVTLEAFAHQHSLDQEKIDSLSTKLCQLERVIAMRDLQLSETEQLVRELQSCTYDGIFVWKISEFSRRRQEAVAGRTPAMFSPGEHKCMELFL